MVSTAKQNSASRASGAGVFVTSLVDAPWVSAGKDGIYQKVAREDHERGLFLGYIAFDEMASSGLHQHQATAISYFVNGGLTDYQGSALPGEAGINLKGATHNAIAYQRSVLVARMDGPTTYPVSNEPLHGLHTGARHSEIVNDHPEVMPDINLAVESVPIVATSVAHVTRRVIFDYQPVGTEQRFSQLQMLPGVKVPAFVVGSGGLELWVRGGMLTVNGLAAGPGEFVMIDPGQTVSMASDYGALVLAWADGASDWADGQKGGELFGF